MPYFHYPPQVPPQLFKPVAAFLAPVTNLFLRLDLAAQGVATPNAAKGTWAATCSPQFTTNAKAMLITAHSGSQTTVTSALGSSGAIGVAQLCSPPIAAPVTLSGSWVIGAAMTIVSATWTGAAALFVMEPDGITIRGTIFNTTNFGASRSTSSTELTVLGSPASSSVTAQVGDYLLLELGYNVTAGSVSDSIFSGGATWINVDNVATSTAQSFLQYNGSIQFNPGTTPLYMRLSESAPSGITLPGAWKGGWGETGTALGKALDSIPGTAQVSASYTQLTNGHSLGIAQFCSPALLAQAIPAQTWTVTFATSLINPSGSGNGDTYIALMNGSTGAVRTVISAIAAVGGTVITATEKTAYSITLSGAAATAQAGDYLLVEIGSSTVNAGPTVSVWTDGTTPITADGTTTASPLSLIAPNTSPLFFPTPVQAVFTLTDAMSITESTHATDLPNVSDIIAAFTALTTGSPPAVTTFYPRLSLGAPSGVTLPAGYIGGWGSSNGAEGGSNARALSAAPGSGQVGASFTGLAPFGFTGIAQFISAPLAAQIIPLGTWTFGNGMLRAGGSTYRPKIYVGILKGDGSGQRASIMSDTTDIGTSAGKSGGSELLNVGSFTTVGSTTVQTGDYLVVCFGVEAITGSTDTYTLYTDGTTPITSDNVAGSDAQAFVTAPAPILFLARSGGVIPSDASILHTTVTPSGNAAGSTALIAQDGIHQMDAPVGTEHVALKDTPATVISQSLSTAISIAVSLSTRGTPTGSTALIAQDGIHQMDAPVPAEHVALKDTSTTTIRQTPSAAISISTSLTRQGTPSITDHPGLVSTLSMLSRTTLSAPLVPADSALARGAPRVTDVDIVHDVHSISGTPTGKDSMPVRAVVTTLGTPLRGDRLLIGDIAALEFLFIFSAGDRMSIAESLATRNTRALSEVASILSKVGTTTTTTLAASATLRDSTGIVGIHALVTPVPIRESLRTRTFQAHSESPRLVDTALPSAAMHQVDSLHAASSTAITGTMTIASTLPIAAHAGTTAIRALNEAPIPLDTARPFGRPAITDVEHLAEMFTHLGALNAADHPGVRDAVALLTVFFFMAADRLLISTNIRVVGARVPHDRILAGDTPITRGTFSTADHAAIADLALSFGAAHPAHTMRIAEQLAQMITGAVRDAVGIRDRAIPTFNVLINERITVRESYTFTLRLKSGRVLGTLTINPAQGVVTMHGVAGGITAQGVVGTITVE